MKNKMKITSTVVALAALVATAAPALASDSRPGPSMHQLRPMPHMDRHFGGPLAALVADKTITQAQADKIENSVRSAVQAARIKQLSDALAALVANNTITQAQADAAKASVPASKPATPPQGRPGHRPDGDRGKLSTWTQAQRTALRAQLAKSPLTMAAITNAAIDGLGLTADQATKVKAAFAKMPRPMDGPRGFGDRDGDGPMGPRMGDDDGPMGGQFSLKRTTGTNA